MTAVPADDIPNAYSNERDTHSDANFTEICSQESNKR